MRTLAIAAMVLGLAACARVAPVAPAQVWRDTGRPIASAALFDAGLFAGSWHVVAAYPVDPGAGCTAVAMTFQDGAMRVDCRDGAALTGATRPGAYPGRILVDLGPGLAVGELWVLWVDFDYRTAVIGTPGGQAGWILNRDPAIPADRMAAAREMLDFNGYDLAGLRVTSR